jgi:hypothetical protein
LTQERWSGWRRGQIDYLEEVVRTNLPRISEAMRLFRSWATARGLNASQTVYVTRTPQRRTLRFSRSGNPAIEASYRTHWVSPELSEKKRKHLAAKANRAPELVVIQPLNTEWTCHRRSGTGDLLMMETPGPACLRCVGLDDLEFLPVGDALLTRRAKAKSTRYAVVVRSAEPVGATNDKVSWSSRRRWQMCKPIPPDRRGPDFRSPSNHIEISIT